MSYYTQVQQIAQVDKNNNIVGSVEKWATHKKNILHRGYTAVLVVQNNIVLQHRKHPAFDGYFDLSFSSHPLFKDGKLQGGLDAVYEGLTREWNIEKKDLRKTPVKKGEFYYQAKDEQSNFYEHEFDAVYEVHIAHMPDPNYEFCYGFSLIQKNQLKTLLARPWSQILTPWAKDILKKRLIS